MAERGDYKLTSCDESSVQDMSQKNPSRIENLTNLALNIQEYNSGWQQIDPKISQPRKKDTKLFKVPKPVVTKQWHQVLEKKYNMI